MTDRFSNYDDAVRHLFESTDYERMQRVRYNCDTFNLDRMTELLAALGHPERRLRSIHIAGTKGKGSTAAMAEAILRRHGLRTGLFTSPHLLDMRERIQLDRRLIDRELLRQLIGRVAEAIDQRCRQKPTYFEYMTAIAFLAFAEAPVDLAVVEVGLGGRLDSTNVLVPEVAIITGISIDHTFQLGPDLAGIAAEKAGIAKPGVPLVVAPQESEAEAVILRAAAAVGSPVIQVGRATDSGYARDVTFAWQKLLLAGRPASRITVTTKCGVYPDLDIPLAGRFQAANAACAIAATEIALGDRLDPAKVRAALGEVQWPGRMQTFPGPVTLVLDGAHNAHSISGLCAAINDYFPGQRAVYVFASAADKDIPGMLDALARAGAQVVFTRTANPRAANPAELAAAYRAAGGTALGSTIDIDQALTLARTHLGPHGVIVACGSLYLAGALLEHPEKLG